MSCSDVLDLIEPIAAGDLGADEAVRAHLQSCVTCAAALASAQRLESALKGMEIPPAPATFSATVMQRIRRLFNLAIVAAVLLMVGGVAAMLNIDAMLAIAGSTLVLLRDGMRASVHEAAPTVATYVAAAGLLASALGMWWWAERRLMF